jgi:hypothetical protein
MRPCIINNRINLVFRQSKIALAGANSNINIRGRPALILCYPHRNGLPGRQEEPVELPLEAKLDISRSVFSEPHTWHSMVVSAWENVKTSNFSPQSLHLYS